MTGGQTAPVRTRKVMCMAHTDFDSEGKKSKNTSVKQRKTTWMYSCPSDGPMHLRSIYHSGITCIGRSTTDIVQQL